jgi:hypothetical protein
MKQITTIIKIKWLFKKKTLFSLKSNETDKFSLWRKRKIID